MTRPIEPEQPPWNADEALDSVEIAPFDYRGNALLDSDSTTSTESLLWSVKPRTREQNWFRRRGYLPLLDDETLEIIRVVVGKESALKVARQQADESRRFETNLSRYRNVHPDPHSNSDPCIAKIDKVPMNLRENRAIADVYSRLWTADLINCEEENEAVFQRTIMMTIINRNRLIFGDTQKSGTVEAKDSTKLRGRLAFSTEVEWTCDPMPTRAASLDTNEVPFQAAPKPDECVSFQRDCVINEGLWDTMPSPLRRLVCYEGENRPYDKRAFGFFVVEARRAKASPEDNVAKSQALNDASQSLHNIFEFFREAKQEDVFVKSVRVFSATASRTGVVIRIHRAVKIDPKHPHPRQKRPIEFTNPPYDLEFQFQEYASFSNDEFTRQKVVDMSCKIMVGYGQGVLYGLLHQAAEAIDKKFRESLAQGIPPANIINDYRHGQIRRPPIRGHIRKTQQSSSRASRGRPGSTESTPRAIHDAIEYWAQAVENSSSSSMVRDDSTSGTTTGDRDLTEVATASSGLASGQPPNRKARRGK